MKNVKKFAQLFSHHTIKNKNQIMVAQKTKKTTHHNPKEITS